MGNFTFYVYALMLNSDISDIVMLYAVILFYMRTCVISGADGEKGVLGITGAPGLYIGSCVKLIYC